jgi:hypothetical protein
MAFDDEADIVLALRQLPLEMLQRARLWGG